MFTKEEIHVLNSLFAGIGYMYVGACLKDKMAEATVIAKLTAEHTLSGKDFERAFHATYN